jgi:hypothetical protein
LADFALRATPGTTLCFRLAWLRHAEPKAKRGGAERDRTADLLIANEALSQLSYGPMTTVAKYQV